MAMIFGGKLSAVRGSFAHMLNLGGDRRNAAFMLDGEFSCYRAEFNAAAATVVADVVEVGDVDDAVVIDVVNERDIYVGDGAIVGKDVVVPIAAIVSTAHIAEAIVDAAVETDVVAPIAAMPAIFGTFIVPIRRRPEGSDIGGHDPGSRNPVIAGRGIAPGAWRPDVIFTRAFRLGVVGERRRRVCRFDGRTGIVDVGGSIRGVDILLRIILLGRIRLGVLWGILYGWL
jgi:hypothetical protein